MEADYIPAVLTFKPQGAISTVRALKLAIELVEQADLTSDYEDRRQVVIDDLTLMLQAVR